MYHAHYPHSASVFHFSRRAVKKTTITHTLFPSQSLRRVRMGPPTPLTPKPSENVQEV